LNLPAPGGIDIGRNPTPKAVLCLSSVFFATLFCRLPFSFSYGSHAPSYAACFWAETSSSSAVSLLLFRAETAEYSRNRLKSQLPSSVIIYNHGLFVKVFEIEIFFSLKFRSGARFEAAS
jgi:hypothetical protein